jgi:hypothetical protein
MAEYKECLAPSFLTSTHHYSTDSPPEAIKPNNGKIGFHIRVSLIKLSVYLVIGISLLHRES